MAIDPLYVPLFTIEEVILNKDTGLPLAGGVVKFFRDLQRLTPKPVFQLTGTPPDYSFASVGTQLTLGLSGTFVDINGNPFVPYAYPYDDDGDVDLYYVTVESSGGVPQFTREAVPYLGDNATPPEDRVSTENELANPQFVEVLFTVGNPVVFSVTGSNTVTPIAPGWDFVTSGTGTITVERLEPTSQNIDTNPPYTLSIQASAGLGSSITLRQRLNHSPSIGRGSFGSASLLAAVVAGGASNISVVYAPSTGLSTTLIPSTPISADGNYHLIQNNAQIQQQANTAATTGYVDINVIIPTSRTIALSSLQLVFSPSSIDVPYDEQTADRQVDHLFHFYKPQLEYKPIPSYLVGWDFALNPCQPLGSTVAPSTIGANDRAKYVWDQTILFTEIDNKLGVSRNTNTGGIGISNGSGTPSKFALIQYLVKPEIFDVLLQRLCGQLKGYISAGTGTIKGTVTLAWTAAGSPFVPVLPLSVVSSIGSNGVPVLAGGWTAIPNINYTINVPFTLTTTDTVFDFSGFDTLEDFTISSTATAFAIIVAFDTLPDATTVTVDYCSLNGGDIPTRPAPLSPDETLRKCQYYYEKSYPVNIAVGTATSANEIYERSNLASAFPKQGHPFSFYVTFKATKRINPAVTTYSVDGTINNIQFSILQNGGFAAAVGANPVNENITSWTVVPSLDRVTYQCIQTTVNLIETVGTDAGDEATQRLQFTADARIGV